MWGVVGRSPSIESESLACSKPHIGHDAQGSDLVAIVLALQAQVGGLREEVGGLRERVKFLENKDNGDAFPPVDKMFEGGGLGGSPGDLELNVVTADREEGGKMESRGEGGPEDGSREGQASPWLTEELEQSYELQESMWDAVVYIGADKNQGGMGYAGSAYTVLLLVLNVAVQALFVVIVWGIVSEPQFDANSVEGFRSWRRNIAHSVNEMEELTQKSLASRVCTSDAGLETSQGQAAAYANIQSYLKMTTGLPAGDGQP
ncbi:hypothetical protein T484DRAFT_1795824 [Baffinella frigidus]|nr:hypothetical protein T484DRAFT_1795824 [Cryptophyta sp. CCMP2293]